VHSETVLKFWYATFYEQPGRAKSAKSKVLEELFDATTNKNSELYLLFKGDKNSPVYRQLLETFWIYEFVVKQRQTQKHEADFVLFADELMAYGVYKLMKKSGSFAQERLEDCYRAVYNAILKGIAFEKDDKAHSNSTYSHTSYFKSSRSYWYLNQELDLSCWPSDDSIPCDLA
jgi:hypothetical protein